MRVAVQGPNGGPSTPDLPDLDDVRALRAYSVYHYRRLKGLPQNADERELGDKETAMLYRAMKKQSERGRDPTLPEWVQFPFKLPGT